MTSSLELRPKETASTSSCPKPKYEVGDVATKQDGYCAFEDGHGRFNSIHDHSGYDSDPGGYYLHDLAFTISFCVYDDFEGFWCYRGRYKVQDMGTMGYGVWAWEWELTTPQHELEQIAQIFIGGENIPAIVRVRKWRESGIFYELDLGMKECRKAASCTIIDSKDLRNGKQMLEIGTLEQTVTGTIEYKETDRGTIIYGFNAKVEDAPETALQTYNPDVDPITENKSSV